MEIISAFISAILSLSSPDPIVLVTLICVVALLVVAECVRQVCKVLSKGKE